jgi:hypothetical protein
MQMWPDCGLSEVFSRDNEPGRAISTRPEKMLGAGFYPAYAVTEIVECRYYATNMG